MRQKGFAPVLIILVIAILGVLGYIGYKYQSYYNQLFVTKSSSPTPTTASDKTATWNTYTDASKAYSFKYPDGLKSDTGAAGSGFESIRFTFVGPAQIASGRTQTELFDGYFFAVTKLGATSQTDPKAEIEKAAQNSKENCKELSPVSSTVIAGQVAYQYSGNCLGTFTITYLSNGLNTYSITELYTNDSYKLITDQILSTFKFTSQTGDVTANWKIYTGTNFTFKYPSEKTSVSSTTDRTTVKLKDSSNLIYFDFNADSDFCAGAVPVDNPEIKSITIEGKQYSVTGCLFGEGGPSGGGSVTSYVAVITNNFKVVILKNYSYTVDANGKQNTTNMTTQEDLNLAVQILSTFKFTR